jgi:hypothetical protein
MAFGKGGDLKIVDMNRLPRADGYRTWDVADRPPAAPEGEGVAEDGDVEPPRQGADALDVVRMFMGDKEGMQPAGVYPDHPKTPDDLPAAQPGIDQYPGVFRLYVT